MPMTVPMAFSSYAGMDIARDKDLMVNLDYADKALSAFSGTVKEVIFDLQPFHNEAAKALHDASVQPVGQGTAG